MNREELKKHITNFRLNLPQGVKFSVIAQSSAVLESSKDLHCEYLYVAMERPGYNWARVTYGEMETRLEGEWVGNSWLKVYPCYNEEHLVMVDDIPCQYVGSTNPFQDDPMLDRPVPKLEDFLVETPSQRRFRMSMPEGYNKQDDARMHEQMMRGGIGVVTGDYLSGLTMLYDGLVESRSASKALLQTPISLKDTPHGEFQAYRRQPFNTAEYRGRLVKCSEEQMKFTDDLEHNLRRYNGASLKVKVTYKRRLKALARAIGNESMTARCMQSPGGHIEPEDHTVDAIRVALSSSGLVRKQLLGEGLYKPGMGRTPMREPQEEGRFYVVDNQPTEKLSEDGVLRFDSTLTNKEDGK